MVEVVVRVLQEEHVDRVGGLTPAVRRPRVGVRVRVEGVDGGHLDRLAAGGREELVGERVLKSHQNQFIVVPMVRHMEEPAPLRLVVSSGWPAGT